MKTKIYFVYNGAGIGGGENSNGGVNDAGIGSGDIDSDCSGGTITISGSSVKGKGGKYGGGAGRVSSNAAGIGKGKGNGTVTVTITGGSIMAFNGWGYVAPSANTTGNSSLRSAATTTGVRDDLISTLSQLQVYGSNGLLYVHSPAEEYISIYSISGAELFQTDAPIPANTKTEITDVRRLTASGSAVIVRGSSGWSKKLLVTY